MRALEAAPGPEREQLFYAIWTVKEALAKALQLPLDGRAALAARSWSTDRSGRSRHRRRTPGGVVLYQPRADLTLAVAWIGAKLPIETWDWPPQQPASWPLIAAISL